MASLLYSTPSIPIQQLQYSSVAIETLTLSIAFSAYVMTREAIRSHRQPDPRLALLAPGMART